MTDSPITVQKHRFFRTLIVLSLTFLAIISWFNVTDFYHTHFFERGLAVHFYNLSKILISLYVIWIIYVTGYATISLVVPSPLQEQYTLSDRFILGFGTGFGVWQLLMLALGYFNLYYKWTIIGLCFVVLCASAKHFDQYFGGSGKAVILFSLVNLEYLSSFFFLLWAP